MEPTLAEQCAVLAAIHDHCVEAGVEPIKPNKVAKGDKPAKITGDEARYSCLKVATEEYSAADANRLLGYLKAIRKMLCPPFRFSRDYRSAVWGDRHFTFTLREAAILSVMEAEGGWLGTDYILCNAADTYLGKVKKAKSKKMKSELARLEVTPRLRDLFKTNPAWGTMIVPHPKTRNLFRLARPPVPKL
jgi:hypothetical protein